MNNTLPEIQDMQLRFDSPRGGSLAVFGKELHGYLQISDDYHKWMHAIIVEFDFIIGADYYLTKEVKQNGEYDSRYGHLLSLEMAKCLSMLERSGLGSRSKVYLDECESEIASGRHQSIGDAVQFIANSYIVPSAATA